MKLFLIITATAALGYGVSTLVSPTKQQQCQQFNTEWRQSETARGWRELRLRSYCSDWTLQWGQRDAIKDRPMFEACFKHFGEMLEHFPGTEDAH